jgi:hypothetical protein
MEIICLRSLLTLIKYGKSITEKIKVLLALLHLMVVEDIHYNPTAEVRTRGVGHYAFSKDNAIRKEQMDSLNAARDETEIQRSATQKANDLRRSKIELRKKEIANKRRKKEVDKFLDGLELELQFDNGG